MLTYRALSSLSVKSSDNPTLNSVDAIIDALPPSIRLLMVDDIEYLLNPGQRNAKAVLQLIRRLGVGLTSRNITVRVTSGIGLSEERGQGGFCE